VYNTLSLDTYTHRDIEAKAIQRQEEQHKTKEQAFEGSSHSQYDYYYPPPTTITETFEDSTSLSSGPIAGSSKFAVYQTSEQPVLYITSPSHSSPYCPIDWDPKIEEYPLEGDDQYVKSLDFINEWLELS
jgi:hypothetical protein